MGTFLALSGVMGKNQAIVVESLRRYCLSEKGGLRPEQLNTDNNNCCVVSEANGNSCIFYPSGFLGWDDASAFISLDLNAPVFSFHIHDGDLWMYILYLNGEIIDRFNPIPDYWQDDLAEEEIEEWKGNAAIVARFVPGLYARDIEKYLVLWNLYDDDDGNERAYPDDEFTREDWQMIDFMRKIGIPYPIDNLGNPGGSTYLFWTQQLPLSKKPSTKVTYEYKDNEPRENIGPPSEPATLNNQLRRPATKKPWWKFW